MNKDTFKKIYYYINKFFKLVSTAIIVILLFVGVLLVYYLVESKKVAKTGVEPKYSLYTIISGSMEPKISVYDIIIDQRIEDPKDLKVGDVITFKSTSSISIDKIVTHRIMDIKEINGQYEFVTKGDANQTADSDTAKFDNIKGKTIMKLPKLGMIQIFLMSKLGWVMVILLPSIALIGFDIYKLFNVTIAKGNSDEITDDNLSFQKEEDKILNQVLEGIYKT